MPHRRRPLASLLAGLAALVGAVPAILPAQQPTTTIEGVITAAQGGQLADADVVVMAVGQRPLTARSGMDGRFRIEGVVGTDLFVIARRVGYGPVRVGLRLAQGETHRVEFELEQVARQLQDLEVTGARAAPLRMAEERLARRRSSLMVREELASFPTVSSALIYNLPAGMMGVRRQLVQRGTVQQGGIAGRSLNAPVVGGAVGRAQQGCLAVSLNGYPPTPGLDVDQIPVGQVEALEIVPPAEAQQDWPATGSCGVVVLWL